MYVHVDRHVLQDLPHEEHELALWLEDRWVEKGERLERLRQSLLSKASWS